MPHKPTNKNQTAQVILVAGIGGKEPPCNQPGFQAAQVFAIAAETGWLVERIFVHADGAAVPMPTLPAAAQRRAGVLEQLGGDGKISLRGQLELLRKECGGCHGILIA